MTSSPGDLDEVYGGGFAEVRDGDDVDTIIRPPDEDLEP